tara:strand:- start:152 stop:1351 length:1200 start_codon:yes stop_codon:yes gene_type:complete
MNSFRAFLSESKNLHMEHLEDAIFNEGSKGTVEAIRFLESVTEMLSGNSKSSVNITVKWDGAPAVFAGVNPENGKFFVGSKSVFNKATPKINYTNADIDKNHPGGLGATLKVALKELKKLNIEGVLQGDVMFTSDGIEEQDIDGESHITFQPNTITYAVPSNSDLAKIIKRAKIGVIWHTKYTGKTMATMKAGFNPNVKKLQKPSSVWYDNASFKDTSGASTFTKAEVKTMQKLINTVKSKFRSAGKFIDELNNSDLISEVKIYGNAQIRQGTSSLSAADFQKRMKDKMQTAIDNLKTDRAKERKQKVMDNTMKFLSKNRKKLQSVFDLHDSITKAKIFIVRKLERVKNLGTFIRTENGFKVTAPEGFVAIDKPSGNALKLVDRLEFSKLNFTVSKNWT